MKSMILIFLLFACSSVRAESVHIYIDADFSVFKHSALAIKKGIETRLKMEKKLNPKLDIKLITLDHRGNTRRSLINFKKLKQDPKAIAVFGGLHSPPLISNKKFINENQILTLVAWAAGGPITRSDSKENWIYRLSIDDRQAGAFLADYSVKEKQCSKPYFLLEDTNWGMSNEKNMREAFRKKSIAVQQVSNFSWGVSSAVSLKIAEKVKTSQADCLFFVGSSKDAKVLFEALGKTGVKLPIYSHWGILAGDSAKMGKVLKKTGLDLKVIATKFSFLNENLNSFQRQALESFKENYNYQNPEEMKPMMGYVHGFDLMGLVIKAYAKVDRSKDKTTQQKQLKEQLENLKEVRGLIKTYRKPFDTYSNSKPNAHEALDREQYDMLRISEKGLLYK